MCCWDAYKLRNHSLVFPKTRSINIKNVFVLTKQDSWIECSLGKILFSPSVDHYETISSFRKKPTLAKSHIHRAVHHKIYKSGSRFQSRFISLLTLNKLTRSHFTQHPNVFEIECILICCQKLRGLVLRSKIESNAFNETNTIVLLVLRRKCWEISFKLCRHEDVNRIVIINKKSKMKQKHFY